MDASFNKTAAAPSKRPLQPSRVSNEADPGPARKTARSADIRDAGETEPKRKWIRREDKGKAFASWMEGEHLPPRPQDGLASNQIMLDLPQRYQEWLDGPSNDLSALTLPDKKELLGKQLAVSLTPLSEWMPDKDIESLGPPSEELWREVTMGRMPARHPQVPSKSKGMYSAKHWSVGRKRKVCFRVGVQAQGGGFYTEVGIDRYKKRLEQVDASTPSPRAVKMAWKIFDAVQSSEQPDYKSIWDDVYSRLAFPPMNKVINEFKRGSNPVQWLGLKGHIAKRIAKHPYPLPGIAGHDSDKVYCVKTSCFPASQPALAQSLVPSNLATGKRCQLHFLKDQLGRFVDTNWAQSSVEKFSEHFLKGKPKNAKLLAPISKEELLSCSLWTQPGLQFIPLLSKEDRTTKEQLLRYVLGVIILSRHVQVP